MHELSVVLEVVTTIEKYASENEIGRIESLVLRIGEFSSVMPQYVEACYPAAIRGTILENAKLTIEVLPCNARCRDCGKISRALDFKGSCPACGSKNFELLGGKEFFIKEIVVVD